MAVLKSVNQNKAFSLPFKTKLPAIQNEARETTKALLVFPQALPFANKYYISIEKININAQSS
jgi:hypothetical protein